MAESDEQGVGEQCLVSSKTERLKCNDKTYELVCSNFGNRIFLLISDTSLQKMGTILQVRREEIEPDQIDTTFFVQTLLGSDQEDFLVFGRAIGGYVLGPGSGDKTLLVACGFQIADPKMIPLVLKTLEKVNVWS